jgi:hypothetical protein
MVIQADKAFSGLRFHKESDGEVTSEKNNVWSPSIVVSLTTKELVT